jgi:hypothetical protein
MSGQPPAVVEQRLVAADLNVDRRQARSAWIGVASGSRPGLIARCNLPPMKEEGSPTTVQARLMLTPSLHRLMVGRTAKLERFGSARHKVQMIQLLA